MNPFVLKDRLIAVLRLFFSDDPDYTYNTDQEQSKIIIADIYGVDRKQVEKFPVIALERGPMQIQRIGIGSLEKTLWAAEDGEHPQEVYTNLVQGRMLCHCITTNGIEAERLAMKLANLLEVTRHELRPVLRVLKLENVQIDQERRIKQWPGQIDVPVVFNYVYPARWKITDKSVLIKKLNLNLNNS